VSKKRIAIPFRSFFATGIIIRTPFVKATGISEYKAINLFRYNNPTMQGIILMSNAIV
jgi:hypothetical protein